MASGHREFTQGLKMTLIAAVSAAVTATLVIAGGEALLRQWQEPAASAPGPIELVRTSG